VVLSQGLLCTWAPFGSSLIVLILGVCVHDRRWCSLIPLYCSSHLANSLRRQNTSSCWRPAIQYGQLNTS